MEQMETILLYCLKKLNSERTIYSIFHLLNGKKSSQTIQDAHLFSLKRLFGIYDHLTRETFEQMIHTLLEKKYIYLSGEQRFLPTSTGELFLDRHPLPKYLDGWHYHPITMLFWERLSLLIQVASNLVYQETRYIPIQKKQDVHIWLKSILQEIHIPRMEIGQAVYSELIECLDEASGIQPSVLVFRLTGFEQIGLTSGQTAKKLNLDIHDYHIGFIQSIHYMIQKISDNTNRFPLLAFILRDMMEMNELTLSSRKTWDLLNLGLSFEKIAELRRLKISTIEDHFVEFALHVDDFSIDDYVEKELQETILKIARQSATKQLKLIKDNVETASYFQIRLVLAKYGDR